MKINEYIYLLARHKLSIILCIILCSISGYFFASQKGTNLVNLNMFLTFSIKNTNANSSTDENLQASDQITETIQGWFKDPALINEINNQSNLSYNIIAKKQEKNNLLVSFDAKAEKQAEEYQKQIINTLQNRLNQYNKNSDFEVKIAVASFHHQPIGLQSTLYTLLGGIIGIIIAIAIIYLFELSSDKIISISTLKGTVLKINKDNVKLIKSLIAKQKTSKTQFIQFISKTSKSKKMLLQALSIKEKDLINFHQEAEQINNGDSIYITNYGNSNSDLEIASHISGKPSLIILL